ncbi:MAG: ATP-binding protein [Nitriliruptorales bacterium]
MLAVGAAIGSSAHFRFKTQGGTRATTLDEAFLVAMLLVLTPRQTPLLLAGAAAVTHVVARNGWTKTAFNAGAMALSATAGALTFAALNGHRTGLLSPPVVGAVLVAVLVYVAANQALVAGLFSQLSSRPYRSMLADTWRLDVLSLAANVALGFPLAIVVAWSPVLGVVSSLLLAGIYLASRSYARAMQERQRTRILHEVTRLLADAANAREAVGSFLDRTRELFKAESAELLVLGADGPTLLRWAGGELVTSEGDPPAEGPMADVLRTKQPRYVTGHEGEPRGAHDVEPRDGLLAPLLHEGRTVGVLAVYDRHGLEPWDDTDAKVLAALADEAAVAIRNVELFESIQLEKAKLAEETRKLSDVMEAASDGIAFIDGGGMVETWNRAMEQITGLSAEEARGRPWFMSLRLRDAEGHEFPIDGPGPLRDALAGGRPQAPLEVQVLRRDGHWRWLRASVAPVVRDAEVAGVVLIARDVTSERESEDLKSDFVSTVSHELRTPLTPLKGFIITAAERWDELPPEQIRQMLTSMLRQVERLETLVGDLLVFAELDRGSARLREQIVELDLLVRTAVESEMRPTTSRRLLLEKLDACRVVADPSAVGRIVRALVDNAVKHTGGSVTISLRKEGGDAIVSVADEGAGISESDRERIFAPFSRLGNHLTRSTQGPGLGLAIAQSLADRLGGRLEVSSELGVGTTFSLRLPLALGVAPSPSQDPLPSEASAEGVRGTQGVERRRPSRSERRET